MKAQKPPPRIGHLITVYFESVPDPRVDRTKHHPLVNILVMALCGAICGVKGWDDLAEFADRAVVGVQSASGYSEGMPVPTSW